MLDFVLHIINVIIPLPSGCERVVTEVVSEPKGFYKNKPTILFFGFLEITKLMLMYYGTQS